MLPIKKIEEFVKKETKNVSSVTHDFGHMKRTSIGAKWFVKILGGSKKEEKLAYIAGLLHDIVRPPSHTICHAEASARKSEQILEKFKLDKNDSKIIVSAIASHRDITKCNTVIDKSLIYADKILEQMGAFIVFRRCMYVGECEEYKSKPLEETIISHFEGRLTKYSPDEFPKRFVKLLCYQYKWPKNFWITFKNNEEWALEIAKYFYEAGRNGEDLEKAIKRFRPKFKESKIFRKEAIEYMNGKLMKKFQEMI